MFDPGENQNRGKRPKAQILNTYSLWFFQTSGTLATDPSWAEMPCESCVLGLRYPVVWRKVLLGYGYFQIPEVGEPVKGISHGPAICSPSPRAYKWLISGQEKSSAFCKVWFLEADFF